MNSLCIIPCGKRKIWEKEPEAGPTRADQAYIGAFHNLCQQYSRLFFQKWVILSAKHGLLLPEDIVPENYDLSFSMKKADMVSTEVLKEQIVKKKLESYHHIVVLGGKKFQPVVENAFGNNRQYEYPLWNCKGLGYMQQKLKNAIEKRKPIMGMMNVR
ncbi:DUF6884 domain-containing protein [Bacillus methanolicus]|uniref:DUF6884 domain-containing protein n=1 Tax=Bacillus methanolicus (strain MGA3 / ATCC 53907) TaxID=796606 RepID=I3E8L7_BACMM|nr:DUF6884 domain-containing protein [Bacillus methanolicus]AIE60110.1 hypothetical protein BMMGA3_08530 [Bacillus methanolicus MGA3]EIJ82838.1 hypothetical protein MGA3_06420 [Bacillus methanolicus MGA3]